MKLTNETIDRFPRGPQNETVSNLFGDVLSRSFNVIGQFMKKCCLLLFSISVVIGQFSSKWRGSSSYTVTLYSFFFALALLQLKVLGKNEKQGMKSGM